MLKIKKLPNDDSKHIFNKILDLKNIYRKVQIKTNENDVNNKFKVNTDQLKLTQEQKHEKQGKKFKCIHAQNCSFPLFHLEKQMKSYEIDL